MNQRVSKKNSVEDDFFDIEGVESGTASAEVVDGNEAKSTSSTATSTTNSRTVSSSNSANSARSGSLSEEVVTSSTRRRPTGQTSVTSRGSRDNLLSSGGSKDSGGNASQPNASDPRLRAAIRSYESAYEWRIASCAMLAILHPCHR